MQQHSLHDEIHDLLQRLEQQQRNEEEEETAPLPHEDEPVTEPEGPTGEKRPQLHIYILNQPLEDHLAALQETVIEQEECPPEPPSTEGPDTMTAPPSPARRHSFRIWMAICLLVVLSLCGGGIALFVLHPFAGPVATVTLLPRVQPATTTMAVAVGANPGAQLPGRVLPRLTLTQVGTVETTGTAMQAAQAASGLITFYNAAPYAQTIPAGTLLTGTNGMQMVTEQDAVIPAVAYPTLGQMTVLARSVTVGPVGNMVAGIIYGPCCRLNVSAVSGAFTGGQNARTYPVVTQHDVGSEAATLSTSLMQSVTAAFAAQLHPDEALVTPVPCIKTISTDHPVETEASQVMVSVSETCEGMSYSPQALQALLAHSVEQSAREQLGSHYQQAGALQTTIVQVKSGSKQGSITMQVKTVEQWSYVLTTVQVQQLVNRIAGKSKQQAILLAAQFPGVQAVTITLTEHATTLPTDTSQIHVLLVTLTGATGYEQAGA